MRFFGVKKWCSANVISYAKQKHVCWKICKIRKGLAVLREQIVVNVKLVEIRETSEVFWAKLYCKTSDLFL